MSKVAQEARLATTLSRERTAKKADWLPTNSGPKAQPVHKQIEDPIMQVIISIAGKTTMDVFSTRLKKLLRNITTVTSKHIYGNTEEESTGPSEGR